MRRAALEILRVARDLAGGRLTRRGEDIRKGIISDYERYGKGDELAVVKAILKKYARELGDDELYLWDSRSLKVGRRKGEEYISPRNRASVVTWTVDGSVRIDGKVYAVKDVVVGRDVTGI